MGGRPSPPDQLGAPICILVDNDGGHSQLAGGLGADLVTGLSTATGVLAALVGRLKTGQLQRMETSIMEAASVLIADGVTQAFELGADPTRTSQHL